MPMEAAMRKKQKKRLIIFSDFTAVKGAVFAAQCRKTCTFLVWPSLRNEKYLIFFSTLYIYFFD